MSRNPEVPRLKEAVRDAVSLAAEVVRQVQPGQPADRALREWLKAQHGLPRVVGTEVSRLVFAQYRWYGWLDAGASVAERCRAAAELDRRFGENPEGFAADELRDRALPSWIRQEMDVRGAWVRCLQKEPPLWIRARPGQGPALARSLGDCEAAGAGRLADALRYTGGQDLFRTPQFHGGGFEVQDLSSQAVGWACAPKAGEVWWDACAGEGGKTLHLSDLMENRGLLWASDRSHRRLEVLRRRAARAKIHNYRCVWWSGPPHLPTRTKFDGVLVDAPCSGVGTWHRNPHARWTLTAEEVRRLAALQSELLAAVAQSVKAGGRLLYAVCTLTRAETTEVAGDFTRAHPGFVPEAFASPLGSSKPSSPQHWLRTEECGGNGMFIAAWRRVSEGQA